jgi:predicted ATP-dependent endonuclease of OLD family
MKIRITELGPIKEAVIDLDKKMTLFCGQNATGKTYLAFVIYFITQLENKNIGIPLDREIIDTLISTNVAVIDLDISAIWDYAIKEINSVKNNLWRYFAVAEDKQQQFFGKTTIEMLEDAAAFEARIIAMDYQRSIKLDNNFSFQITKQKNEKKLTLTLLDENIKNIKNIPYLRLVLLSRIYSLLIFAPVSSSTIFPVERNSILTFHNELKFKTNYFTNELAVGITGSPIEDFNRYPKPIKDALAVADDLEQIQKRKSIYFEFAEQIEQELLKGKLIVSKEGKSVEFKSDKAKTLGLSFHQSSSIVKMLASLIIYLKHIAVENDLIIIDEPELNLHPSNQILLTQIFAKLINKGLRLIISTHSDYIIREINNLLMLGAQTDNMNSIAADYGYTKDQFIKQNDIAVYFFDYVKNSKKIDVKPIAVSQTGFSVKSIDDTIDRQNQISEDLFYTLKYGKIDKNA